MDPIETPIDRLDDAERPAALSGTRRLAEVTRAATGIG